MSRSESSVHRMSIKPIALALREARTAVLRIALLTSAMDTLVVYAFMLVGCTIFALPLWWAVVPAFAYGLMHTQGLLKDVSFANIEKTVPSLKEQLITVADNWREQNEIVEALNAEVLQKMKDIRTSYFLDLGRLSRELVVMTVASFLIIGISAFDVKFLDIPQAVKELREFKTDYDLNEELLQYEESTNLSEILGDKSITELGQQQLDLQLNPLKSDIDIGNVNDPQDRRFREVPPREISATSDASYEEDIPRQYQKVVKTYFKGITES